ncbi:nodulation protein NoeA [soil metagenome]
MGDTTVTRLLDDRGLADWRVLAGSRLFAEAVGDGRLIDAREVEAPEGVPGALEHPRVAVITYPFEWTFSMLRDAALLQLDLMAASLEEGMILKDATPYNVQFVGGRPQFIDIGSFEKYRAGDPWVGYRQFCRQFLYPLMLRAWAGIPFQPWLRGDPEGPTAEHMRHVIPWSRRLTPRGFLHVGLQARAESRMKGEAVRSTMAEAGFSAKLISANVAKLTALVESLVWDPDDGSWVGYHGCDHVGRDRDAKSEFLEESLARVRPATVLDVGANDGHFSRLAVAAGAVAVALDGEEAVLDRLYRSQSPDGSVIPVLADASNPSPAQGWASVERPGLFDRVRPDLVLAYGLIHHLVYTSSIPPARVVEWLATFGADVVVEFVAPDDPMVGRLTANKRPEELHPGRLKEDFERLVATTFEVVASRPLEGETRQVYHLRPR